MPAVAGGSYAGVSAAQRRTERRARLLGAGLEVIGTEGWSAATVRAICREAGLSSRYFYESFDSIEQLAAEIFDGIFQRATQSVIDVVDAAPRDPHLRNRVAIETFVRELSDDPRVARFAFIETLGSQLLVERRLAALRSAVEALLVHKRQSRRQPRATETYREVVATVLIGGLAELLIAWMHGRLDAELPQLVDAYIRLANDVGDLANQAHR
ncbi:MAG: TetR/AcrR family transcriptional regulator [Actinobacteria bacterium]|nr:TetR/AcrR family transcriptional regulator [Actinomycetota bacterium]MBV8960317.1 TetR/AcrR family transcriptional regulator [Actinomycetota bacterium]MBV9255786.1 TetR/AcrR family transcriptional regulator [Actinomycetota bacterium]MBV9662773.1 TetR/AcrR family transcriptional regulator [Actinomycetota bacterium]MBV9933908.1 TetR/AcrR family transcriptional regulator [Actinomycetota bacterium]